MKKVLSIILAAAMILSLIPSVFALEVADDGSVTYTFGRSSVKKADGTAISIFDVETEGVWEWMEESTSTEVTPVYYHKTWFVGNVVGFGGHGWKFYDMNATGLKAAETQYKVGQIASAHLQIANKVDTTSVENDTVKLAVGLEKPGEGFYSVSTVIKPVSLGAGAKYPQTTRYYMNPESSSLTAENSVDENALLGEVTYKKNEDTTTNFSKIIYVSEDIVFTVNPQWCDAGHTLSQGDQLKSLTLEPVDGEAELVVADIELLPGEETTAAVKVDDKVLLNSFVDEYVLSENPTIEIDALGNIKATAVGPTTITAMVGGKPYEATVNVKAPAPAESPEYVSAFTPSDTVEGKAPANADVIPLAYATDGSTIVPANIKATDSENGTWTVKTDSEVGEYKFRYWAKGLESKERKRIVSFANEFTYTPSNEKNYLIAVYDKAGTTAAVTEYYNANGQLIPNADDSTKVYMAGYEESTGWKEPVYGIKEAIYGEPIKYNITIGDAEPVEYAWGTPVVCPEPKAPEGQEFWGWKKTVNNVDAGIVSTDENYTFYAWEHCTVTPVFGVGTPVFGGEKRRIILGTFMLGGKTAVMAEFFGFDNALERGITIGGTDYAMTNKIAKQFTIVDDDNKGNISAYAILANGTKYIYNLNK